MRPICMKCHMFFVPKKNGFYFLEGMPVGERVQPGLAEAEKWKPYKLWAGDKMICRGCGTEIIYGFGMSPISEHYKPEFTSMVKSFGADQFQVNDC